MSGAVDAPVPQLLVTLEQAAEACQVGRTKMDEWSRRAGFPVIRESGTVRIPLDLLKSWLAEQALLTNQPRPVAPVLVPTIPLIPPKRRRR